MKKGSGQQKKKMNQSHKQSQDSLQLSINHKKKLSQEDENEEDVQIKGSADNLNLHQNNDTMNNDYADSQQYQQDEGFVSQQFSQDQYNQQYNGEEFNQNPSYNFSQQDNENKVVNSSQLSTPRNFESQQFNEDYSPQQQQPFINNNSSKFNNQSQNKRLENNSFMKESNEHPKNHKKEQSKQLEDNKHHKVLKQQNENENYEQHSYKSTAKSNKKSEIEGNPSSWNQIEFDEQGEPIIVKQCENPYDDFLKEQQNQSKLLKKKTLNNGKNNLKAEKKKKSSKPSQDSQVSKQENNKPEEEIIPQKINLTYEEFMNQQNNQITNNLSGVESKKVSQKPKFRQQNSNSVNDQQITNQSIKLDRDQISQIDDKERLLHSNFEGQQTQNILKEDNQIEIDQRSAYDQSVRTNNNMNFDNQTIQDDELRGEYEEDNNLNSLVDDKLSTKKMMISDKSFKIDLILNHQPTISAENYKYHENKEKFQLFFQRNADKIIKQIQRQGSYRKSSNEYVLKFGDFFSFFSKIFESDNFILIESEQNLSNIMKNKNISLILSTILKEFLKTVRKVDEKQIIDEKNIELGVEDMMDFFEFWIRVDEQLLVKYDIQNQNHHIESSKTASPPTAQSPKNQKDAQNNEQLRQSMHTQARLQSLLEGNIKKLESIQKQSVQNDIQQQNIINSTLQFLKSQYKKFEVKSLEEQQNEKMSTGLRDSDINQIQQQIIQLFKEYSSLFSAQAKKYTFDDISQSQNFMNINNFFKFVKDFGLQSDKVQGAQIIEIFNRNCTGKQMNYSQYLQCLLKIVEIKENCVFVEQKTQIIAVAKMLKLKIQLNSKENNSKVKKYAFDTSSSTKSIGSQNRSLSPKSASIQSKPPSQPQDHESNKLNWQDLEKLSYQQINSLGNKKNTISMPNQQPPKSLRREIPVRKMNDQNNTNTNKGEESNKKIKNQDDNFNPNDLIDVDDEKETNEILDKQYRITKSGIVKKNSIHERDEASPRLPRIGGPSSENSSKPQSEASSQKDSITNVRMIKQIKNIPKAQSTSPPPNQQSSSLNQNKQPRVNGYGQRFKQVNVLPIQPKRGSHSPNQRVPLPLQQVNQQNRKKIAGDSPEKERNPKMLIDKNQLMNNNQQYQQNTFQQNPTQEDQAIQDAILKSTQFRNFLKNRAMQIQNDMTNLKQSQNLQDLNSPIKLQGQNEQQQLQKSSLIPPQSFPPYSQQQPQQPLMNQQNIVYKKNTSQPQTQQQQQLQQQQQHQQQIQQQNLQGNPQPHQNLNLINGNYSFGKNQSPINQHNEHLNQPHLQGRGSQLVNQLENHQNNQVRVIPVMNHQQFNQDKI